MSLITGSPSAYWRIADKQEREQFPLPFIRTETGYRITGRRMRYNTPLVARLVAIHPRMQFAPHWLGVQDSTNELCDGKSVVRFFRKDSSYCTIKNVVYTYYINEKMGYYYINYPIAMRLTTSVYFHIDGKWKITFPSADKVYDYFMKCLY